MKLNSLRYICLSMILSLPVVSCNDLEDNDYYKNEIVQNVNEDIRSTSMSIAEYIQSRPDFSQMSALFQKEGIYEEMQTSGELHTLFVVNNETYVEPEAEESNVIARSHVASISISPFKLQDRNRLKMWHDKYVTVNFDSLAKQGVLIDHTTFNNKSTLKEVIKASDGFVYVIDNLIVTPTSLQDFINELDDTRFHLFKDMVLSSGGKKFDRNNSKVIGVDSYGNTLYDSVFIYTNDFFDAKGFNLSDESLTATMLYFSDEAIAKALADAKERLHRWDYDHKFELLRNGSLDSVYVGYSSDKDIEDWILKAAFYWNSYSVEELTEGTVAWQKEIKSIYDNIWRTDIQVLDLEHPSKLSNGMAYEVKSFRIPTHRLIYRLHEEFNLYNKCDADQKAEYFKATNLANFKVATFAVGEWTPLAGIWPLHSNSPLECKVKDATQAHFQMDFTPIFSVANDQGGFDVKVMMVPPGPYRFAMGFMENMCDIDIQLFGIDTNDELVPLGEKVHEELPRGSQFQYDRGHQLKNALPEYYDPKEERYQEEKKREYYWTDGEAVYPEVEIPDFKGDGSPVRLMISISGETGTTYTGSVTMNHWCLRPTTGNY